MEEKGTTEGEVIGWHHQLNGHEFEQALRVHDGQGGHVNNHEVITWLSCTDHVDIMH